MANHRPLLMDPEGAARKAKDLDPELVTQAVQLARRMVKKKPTRGDLSKLRKWLSQYPELLCKIFDLAEFTRSTLIEHMISGDETRDVVEASVAAIRQEFGYDGASIMEKLLIEDILVSWLRVQWLEYRLSMLTGGSTSEPMMEFLERRLSISQRRYHAACQTLAKIRELASRNPTVQLNVATQGGQQVNVTGNLAKQG